MIGKLKVLPDDVTEDVRRLAADPMYADAHMQLADVLIKVRDPRAGEVLTNMLTDPRLAPTAAIALGLRGDEAGRPTLEQLVNDPDPSVWRQASMALRKLDGQTPR